MTENGKIVNAEDFIDENSVLLDTDEVKSFIIRIGKENSHILNIPGFGTFNIITDMNGKRGLISEFVMVKTLMKDENGLVLYNENGTPQYKFDLIFKIRDEDTEKKFEEKQNN